MFVTWTHYLLPKFTFIMSYLFNPLFIYLIHTTDHSFLGSYRCLSTFFAIFNMLASMGDLLVPVCVFSYRYVFVTFLVGGPFSERSQFGEDAIAYRCAFISATYGILNAHFIFRYLVLKKNDLVTRYFMPYGLILAVFCVLFHYFVWMMIDMKCLYSAPEMRDYIRQPFRDLYHVEIDEINFVAGMYLETSQDIINRSWAGIVLFTFIACYSITLYIVLGYKIITGINNALGTMSQKTAQMQKQLLKALTIQTVIPVLLGLRWLYHRHSNVPLPRPSGYYILPPGAPKPTISQDPTSIGLLTYRHTSRRLNSQIQVNWAHYIIPKCSFVLSYISNPLFIYLIHNNNQVILGPYRYLLYFFACFNMIAALADLLVPVCVHNYRYAFVTFLVDGPFSERSQFGENSIAYRCAFISGTYGILNVHFVFRYMILKRNDLITHYFMPYGLIISVVYVILHWFIWAQIDLNFIYSTQEMREYVRESFKELYQEDIDKINFVAGLFSETSEDIVRRSWAGILLLTLIASYSMILYLVLGYKIITGINNGIGTMSSRTANVQKQLFKALTIQTVIPICVSFLPCTLSFYGAALRFDFVEWVYWGSTIAISMFPFLDPMAIIFFLPALRKRLGFRFPRATVTVITTDYIDNS